MNRFCSALKSKISCLDFDKDENRSYIKYKKMSASVNFPDESKIKEKQEMFRQKLSEEFTTKKKKYDSLLRKSKRNTDNVDSSKQTPETDEISLEEGTTFEQFYDMTLGRKKQSKARGIYRTLSRAGGDNSVGAVVNSVAKEISVAFQYQLAMLAGADDIAKAARFAVRAIMHHIKSPDAVISESALMDAILEDTVHSGLTEDLDLKTDFPHHKDYSGIQWTAEGLFREPGIRWPEDIVCSNNEEDEGKGEIRFSGSFTPFGCCCRPKIYGYRAPIHVKDAETGGVLIYSRDRTTLCRLKHTPAKKKGEIIPNVHQQFKPTEAAN